MINIDELKPILEPLLTEENSADIIAEITKIDKAVEVDQTAIDTAVENAKSEKDKEWGEKFKQTFFSTKKTEVTESRSTEEVKDPVLDDIFEETK